MQKRSLSITAILLFSISAVSQSTGPYIISGNLKGQLHGKGGIYIVTDNLSVNKSDTVIIPEGSIFKFKPFTSLRVDGKLIVAGTEEKPVLFSSYNDTSILLNHEDKPNGDIRLAPEPFDWNGIVISYTADTAELYFFEIRYATFGLKCEYDKLKIYQGKFVSNGQYHLTIQGKIMDVFDRVGYTYPIGFSRAVPIKLSANETAIPYQYDNKKNNVQKKRPRVVIPAISGGCGVALMITGVFFNSKTGKANREVKDNQADYFASTNTNEMLLYKNKDNELREKVNTYRVRRNIFYTAGSLFLATCGITIILEL
jgi:hypothetical protein